MSLLTWVLDSAGALLALVLAYVVALFVRRRVLSRHGGTFELSCRLRTDGPGARAGRGWVLGMGRYTGEDLEWFRIFSLSPRPKRVWTRRELAYTGRRDARGPESLALYPGHVVVVCRTPRGPLELAMAPESLTGLQAWLEAGPPGSDFTVPPRQL